MHRHIFPAMLRLDPTPHTKALQLEVSNTYPLSQTVQVEAEEQEEQLAIQLLH